MSKPVLIVLHQEHSTPGRVGYALRQRGFALDARRPPLGEPLPQDLTDYAGVVVFGGPMSANDPDAFIGEEIKLIERTLKADTPFLGLCLGAQLLCRALGTRVFKHPEEETEIGYYPLRPTKAGETWARSCGAVWPRAVYHWHREGFDLPKGAELLAEGDAFLHQAFRMGQKTLALQFHPEVTYAMICRWTTRAFERMNHKGARAPHEHREGWFQHDHDVGHWLDAVLDGWIGRATALSPQR